MSINRSLQGLLRSLRKPAGNAVSVIFAATAGFTLPYLVATASALFLVLCRASHLYGGGPDYIPALFDGLLARGYCCAAVSVVVLLLASAPPLKSARARACYYMFVSLAVTAALIGREAGVDRLGRQLIEAINAGDASSALRALNSRADPNARDIYDADFIESDTPPAATILAAERGQWTIVGILLRHGGDVNARGIFGETVVITAAANGREDLVAQAIALGADVNATDNNRESSLQMARSFGHVKVAEMLRMHGAR